MLTSHSRIISLEHRASFSRAASLSARIFASDFVDKRRPSMQHTRTKAAYRAFIPFCFASTASFFRASILGGSLLRAMRLIEVRVNLRQENEPERRMRVGRSACEETERKEGGRQGGVRAGEQQPRECMVNSTPFPSARRSHLARLALRPYEGGLRGVAAS